MKLRADQIDQLAVRIICALALLFVGFAHQVPAFAKDSLSPAALAQYVLPDGTLPTLCITVVDNNGKEHGKVGHLNPCEACRISASVLLPQPADATGVRMSFGVTIDLPRRVEILHRQLYPPNTGPRAPPADPILA
ncbi:hypothetical protein [Rhizobium leguminosarum]|uniref:DUF2946 domain-containing protein n=1 Tax=Rhizobium leguminosarum TaxID=384 RepID=A0A7K3VMH4_RHILE|nr:hypothetical protein [Rhizobium leguminosarum]MBY5529328.1 hypothetical protein [Rhizobium leguminosarum]NEK18380.1 hypothetical protein [Rhizobium leguminosarum]